MTTSEAQGQRRTVYLIRHGEKNPSTAAVDPNQLTETGRRGALAFGASLKMKGDRSLEVVCSTDGHGKPVDRSHDTGWYVHAGYAGLEYASANALFCSDSDEKAQLTPRPFVDPDLLKQEVPSRVVAEYRAGKITRAEAMEQCYKMLAANPEGLLEEREQMRRGAMAYLVASLTYLIGTGSAIPHQERPSLSVVLVGHDPNIGCLQQLLEPTVKLKEVAPLEGIIMKRYELKGETLSLFLAIGKVAWSDALYRKLRKHIKCSMNKYSFTSAGKEYYGFFNDERAPTRLLY